MVNELAGIAGTILMTMMGWLMFSVRRAHTRIDELKDEKASREDLKELKQDMKEDATEIKQDVKEIRRLVEDLCRTQK